MPSRPDRPCADCGKLMWRGRGSLPAGQARCQPCRRASRAVTRVVLQPTECRFCSTTFTPQTRDKLGLVYCPDCRVTRRMRRGRRSTTEQGYGSAHQSLRRLLLPEAIGRPCPFCQVVMAADEALDLDHSVPISQGGTTGDRITHAHCNRAGRATVKRNDRPLFPGPCRMCGGRKSDSRHATCSRACGWAWRRAVAA